MAVAVLEGICSAAAEAHFNHGALTILDAYVDNAQPLLKAIVGSSFLSQVLVRSITTRLRAPHSLACAKISGWSLL
jgi:hypothetical protein